MENTWLKLYRSIIDSAVFDDAELLRVWIWVLCSVAFEEHDVVFHKQLIHLEKGQFVTGRKIMARQLGLTEWKASHNLKILEDLGMISLKTNSRFSLVTVEKWAIYQDDSKKTNSKPTADQQQTNSKPTQHKKDKNGKNIYINNIYSQVVSYLNEKAGKNFKATSKTTKEHINGRLAEGYTLDDFKKVIDIKCKAWKGTKMDEYLRPSTLFGTKFESYLNTKEVVEVKKGHVSNECRQSHEKRGYDEKFIKNMYEN